MGCTSIPWLLPVFSLVVLMSGQVGQGHPTYRTMRGHKKPVWSVAWSPDSKLLASVCAEELACRIWDVATDRQLRVIQSFPGQAVAVNWTQKRLLIATVSKQDDTVSLWDSQNKKLYRTLREPPCYDGCNLAWSTDGERLAAWCYPGWGVRIWGPTGGKPVILYPQGADVANAAWSPDGKRLAIESSLAQVSVWDGVTGEAVRILQVKPPGLDIGTNIRPLAWSPDGRYLAGTGYHNPDLSVRIWDVSSGSEYGVLARQESQVAAMAWSPDGSYLAYTTGDGVRLSGFARGKKDRLLPREPGPISLAWSPDGKLLAGGCFDGTVLVWSLSE
jgi:WD40 repeat protein